MKKQLGFGAIIAAVIGALFLLVFGFQSPAPDAVIKNHRTAQTAQCTLTGTTPAGVRYRAVSRPSAAIEAALDRGASHLDMAAAFYDYQIHATRDSTLVYLVPEERLSFGGVPSLTAAFECSAKHFDSYCGGDYDKGVLTLNKNYVFDSQGKIVNQNVHYQTVAEQVMTDTLNNEQIVYTVVVPRVESEVNLQLVTDGYRFGGEHKLNYWNNRSLFDATVGSGNDRHPSLPLPGEPEFPFQSN